MTTNSTDVNDELMDVEKSGVTDEGRQHETEKFGLVGPLNFSTCIHFIMMSAIISVANQNIGVYLQELFQKLFTYNTISDNVMDELQEFVNKFALNLYICIIDQNGIKYVYLKTTTVHDSRGSFRAFLVFDKLNQSLHPFYIYDNNNKTQTIFPADDTDTLHLFQITVASYNGPSDDQAIQQSLNLNIPVVDQRYQDENSMLTINVNYHTNIVNNQSDTILKASDFSNLLVQNLQSLIPSIGPQLDSLNYLFKASEHQLSNNDFASPETAYKALHIQLQMFSKLLDLTAKSLQTNHITQTSTEITEATSVIRDGSLNNHEQNILSDNRIITEQSLPLHSESTIYTNTSPPPITTDNFNDIIRLPKLELLNQPQRLRHNREPKTIGKGCPAVQVEGAPQRTPLLLKLPQEIKNFEQEFYVGAHVKTYDGHEHSQKNIRPKHSDEFDESSKGIFSKITSDDLKNLEKKITLLMFNFKQDEIITKDLIKDNKLIWCRLMFAIYIKLSNGQFKCVSPVTYSDLIEDTHRSQLLDIKTIRPEILCERGGQMIFIQLSTVVKKNDIHVHCNDKILGQNDYQIAETILSFESPVCSQDREELKIVIDKKNINNWIHFILPYISHDDHLEPCSVINTD